MMQPTELFAESISRTRNVRSLPAALFLLVFVGSLLSSVTPAAQGAKPSMQGRPLSPEERRQRQARIKEVKAMLKEAREGKRDDAEKYVLLRHLLTNYAILQMHEASPDVRAAKQEWDDLLRKHPEFKTNPPREIREQRELRELQEKESKEYSEKAKSFVPADRKVLDAIVGDREVAVVYQYRLEFFKLGPHETARLRQGGPGEQFRTFVDFERNGQEFVARANKTLNFKTRIQVVSRGAIPILVCSDHLAGYGPSDNEESKTMRIMGHPHWMPWRMPAGFDDFCGIIDLRGGVVFQFPIRQSIPSKLVRPVQLSEDGKKAIVIIGERVVYGPDDATMVGNPSQVAVWRYPDRFDTYSAQDDRPEVRSALELSGFEQKR